MDNQEKRQLSQYSDGEVIALYEECGRNAAKAASQVGCGPSTFRRRIKLLNDAAYKDEKEKDEACAYVLEELEARGIDPLQVHIQTATVRTKKNRWNVFHKNNEGEAITTPLKGDLREVNIKFKPRVQNGPKWPVIKPADPIIFQGYSPPVPPVTVFRKRSFIIGDVQAGYWHTPAVPGSPLGSLVPYHDLNAISVTLQMLADYRPDEVIIIGDLLDIASLSRYLQLPEFQLTLQPSIEFVYRFLATIRKIVGPGCKIVYLEGNHERRLNEYIVKNAREAFGLKPANSNGDDWPAHSIPTLLRLSELEIEYSTPYPHGVYWITPKLYAVHNQQLKKLDLRASVISGHNTRDKMDSHVVNYYEGQEVYRTWVVPGLQRVAPLMPAGEVSPWQLCQTPVPTGQRPHMDATQAVATAEVYEDNLYKVTLHPIENGRAIFGDQVIHANDVEWPYLDLTTT